MYANGLGVTQNYGEAFDWWRLAAEQGHEEARARFSELETASPQEDRQAKQPRTAFKLERELAMVEKPP